MSRRIICDVCDAECENQAAVVNFKRIDICEYCQIALGEILMEPKGRLSTFFAKTSPELLHKFESASHERHKEELKYIQGDKWPEKGLTGEGGLYPGKVFFQRDAKAELLKAAAGVREERDRTFLSNSEQEMDFTGVWRTSTGALIQVIKEKDSVYPWFGELKEQFIGITAGSHFWIDKQGNVINSAILGHLAQKQRGEESI